MQQKFKFELNISLADGGASAGDVIELYGVQIRDDIDQTAWNMCGCDDQVQSEKFSDLTIENWSVTHQQGDLFHVVAQFTVNSLTDEYIDEVIGEYMDGFADSITVTLNGYYSRTGERIAFSPYPVSWELQIN